MTGTTSLNLVRRDDLTRPEIDNIKVRITRLETQENTGNTAVKNSVASGESITVASGYQRLAWSVFTVIGTITVAGDLVILS